MTTQGDWEHIATLWSVVLDDPGLAAFLARHGAAPAIVSSLGGFLRLRGSAAWLDLDSLTIALRRLAPATVITGLEQVAARAPAVRRHATWLAAAIREHAEALRDDPDALPTVVHNFLRGVAGRSDALVGLRWPARPWPGLIVRLRRDHPQARSAAELRCTLSAASLASTHLLRDGRHAVTGPPLRVWDLHTGAVLRTIAPAPEEPLNRVTWLICAEDRWLVTCGRDARKHRIVVRELATDRVVHTFGVTGTIDAVLPWPDARHILIIGNGRGAELWDLERGRRAATLQGTPFLYFPFGYRVRPLITLDHQHLMLQDWRHAVHVWDIAARRHLGTYATPPRQPRVHAALDATRVLLRERDCFVVHDLATGQPCATLDDAHPILPRPDGHALHLIRSLRDMVARADPWQIVAVDDGLATTDGRLLTETDYTIELWDLPPLDGSDRGGGERPQPDSHRSPILACAVTPDGHAVVTASTDRVVVWPRDGGRPSTWASVGMPVLACVVLPDGQRVACRSAEHLSLRTLASGEVLACRDRGTDTLECSPDGRWFAAIGTSSVHLHALSTLRPLGPAIPVHGATAWCVLPGGDAALLADADGLRLVSLPDAQPRRRWPELRGLTSLLLLSDTRLAAADRDGIVHILSLTDPAVLRLPSHDGGVLAIQATLDGQRLVVATGDGSLRAWDPRDGAPGPTFIAADGLPRSFALSPDARRLVSAGEPSLQVFDVTTGVRLHTVPGAVDFTAVACMPDLIVAGDRSGDIWLLAEHGQSPSPLP